MRAPGVQSEAVDAARQPMSLPRLRGNGACHVDRMTPGPEQRSPAKPDTADQPPVADDAAVGSSVESGEPGGRAAGEESFEPTDAHPDTPDDLDEDAVAPRESVEAVPDDE